MTRWEVFKQDAEDKPHQAVGSVHAADARHALVTAAHVFARRPSAYSLWVARAADIYSRTAEQLAEEREPTLAAEPAPATGAAGVAASEDAPLASFHVFLKSSHRRSMTFVEHVATVEAATPAAALALASAATAEGSQALAWWVVRTSAITASAPSDAASWFEPAKDKTYKQQSQYGIAPTRTSRRGP